MTTAASTFVDFELLVRVRDQQTVLAIGIQVGQAHAGRKGLQHTLSAREHEKHLTLILATGSCQACSHGPARRRCWARSSSFEVVALATGPFPNRLDMSFETGFGLFHETPP